ncbi:MAG: hypothetical protein GX366_05205 [Epulopiscium sp.]|nr:hypothetical protein [Candidatus Epulonipiscium sp.]
MLGAIVDYIIETVQTESQLTGFQYIINYTSIEKDFNITLNDLEIEVIEEELQSREEVADVEVDKDGFDVVLCTDYAPNYYVEENM